MQNLNSQSAYGDYLSQGSAMSYDEFQKRAVMAGADLQLQSIQLNNQEVNYQLNQATQQAQQKNIERIQAANTAINSFNQSVGYQRQLNKLSNDLTAINRNVISSNIQSLKGSAIRDLQNANSAINAQVGNVYASYGASDIVAGTGSALDVANYIEKQGVESGYNTYNQKINQVNDQLAKSLQLQSSQDYENLSLDSKIYLESVQLNKTIY